METSPMTIIVVAILALAAGLAMGILINRRFGHKTGLEEKLAEAEQRHADYRREVTEHFRETSERVHALTRNYKEVHDYLASSAIKLANADTREQLFSTTRITLPASEQAADAAADEHHVIDHERADHTTAAQPDGAIPDRESKPRREPDLTEMDEDDTKSDTEPQQ